MATSRAWAEAYLAQARADLDAVSAIGSASPSTSAMLWQMVFEKYAKAALLRQGSVALATVQTSHKAASRMIEALRRQRDVFSVLGGARVWEDVLWLVEALERAHPQLAQPTGPRLEYPWEDSAGEVWWPAKDLQIAQQLSDPRRGIAVRVLRFARLLDQHFEAMFA